MKTIFIIFILNLIYVYLAIAHVEHVTTKGIFTKHFNESLFKITENGLFSIEILPDEKEYKIGKNVVGLVIHDENDRDVEGALISITLEDAARKSFAVREKGGGLYTVSNLDLRGEGYWKLKIKVKKKKIEDEAIFVFPDALKYPMPAGKYEFK